MLTTAGATIFTTGAKVRLICWVEVGTVSCASAGTAISAATIRPIRAIQNRIGSLQHHPPPPTRGRVGVGEASDDYLPPKRGFALPTLPRVGEGIRIPGGPAR